MSLLSVLSGRLRADKLKRLIRRVHMFAGLLLLPWLLFFGISGVLFNHPGMFERVHAERVSEEELRALGSLAAWQPQASAKRVVAALNALAGAHHYQLDAQYEPELSGFTALSAPSPKGRYMLLLDMQRPAGVLVTRTRTDTAGSSFPETQLLLPELSTSAIERGVVGLLARHKLPLLSELKAHPKIAPELRFRVRDQDGQAWNLSYDTRSSTVSGRRSDAFPSLGVAQLLAAMHTTHHFPLRVGALWFWALFEDLLGVSMVIWSLSGLVMWWQIKRTRLWGVLSIAVALAIAAVVMVGTLDHLRFADVKQQLGPGE